MHYSEGIDAKLAPYLTTNIAAQDMEHLRQHLQQRVFDGVALRKLDRINLLGMSYGGRLFAHYTHLYVDHVRSLILDSDTLFLGPDEDHTSEYITAEAQHTLRALQSKGLSLGYLKSGMTAIAQQYPQYWSQIAVPQTTLDIIDSSFSFGAFYMINCMDQGYVYTKKIFKLHPLDVTLKHVIRHEDDCKQHGIQAREMQHLQHSQVLQNLPFPVMLLSSEYDRDAPAAFTRRIYESLVNRYALWIHIMKAEEHGIALRTSYINLVHLHLAYYINDPEAAFHAYPTPIQYPYKTAFAHIMPSR